MSPIIILFASLIAVISLVNCYHSIDDFTNETKMSIKQMSRELEKHRHDGKQRDKLIWDLKNRIKQMERMASENINIINL